MIDNNPAEERLQREALTWLSRISLGQATSDDLADLRRWRDQSSAHAAALAEAGQLWRALEAPVAALADSGIANSRPGIGVNRRIFMGGGAIAASAAAVALMVRPPLDLWPSFAELAADHRTGTGEQLHLTLRDAISVDLNTRTSIAMRPGAQDEELELISGETAIAIGHGVLKPLIVAAAEGRMTATRASFNVRRNGSSVDLTCIDGEVVVACGGREATLRAAQKISYDSQSLGDVIAIDPATVTAWRDGLLVFRNAPLASVIDEVNRYRPGRIMLIDAGLGQRLVTARFEIKRLDTVMGQIGSVFKVPVRSFPGGLVLVG
jgi:transmembrane sensor